MSITTNLYVLRHKETQKYVRYDDGFFYFMLVEDLVGAFFFDDPDNFLFDRLFLAEGWEDGEQPDNLEFELVELSGAILSVTPFSNLAL